MAFWNVMSAVGIVVLCEPVRTSKNATLSVHLLGGQLMMGRGMGVPGMSECILYTETNSSVRE
jgi:hypothetical protein